MKSKFFHSLSNSLAIHIDLPQKKLFKRNAELAHPKLFSRGKRSSVNVSMLLNGFSLLLVISRIFCY